MRRYALYLLILALLLAVALPLLAQTPTPDPAGLVVVVGNVDLTQGVIMVNNYIIAPASAFEPSILRQGDLVVVVGYLLPDGVTIQAISLELFAGTMTPTPNLTWTPTFTPTPNLTITPTFTPPPSATPVDTTCARENHPVANRLADDFGVSYDEIISWHCMGFGFGEIARAYLLADATGVPAATYFAQRQAGMGWGEIMRQADVHPSQLAPGQVIRPHGDDRPGRGNGNNGNGNNGNGRDNR